MRRMLQISFVVFAMGLLFGGSSALEAQRYVTSYNSAGIYAPQNRVLRRRRHVRKKRYANARDFNKVGQSRRKARRWRKRRSKRSRARSRRKKRQIRKKLVARKKSNINISPKEPVQIVVSLPRQRVSIYKGGQLVTSSRISSGKAGHRTPAGIFSIIQKHRRHYSNLYNSAPMPYMQRITWSGIALHAGNVNRPFASHGCIRLPYGFAKTLFRRTSMGAHVIVASTSASPQSISHDNLFQPLHEGVVVASNNPQGSTYPEQSTIGDTGPKLELGGLPGFVKPVVLARQKLEQTEQTLKKSIAAIPAFEKVREEAEKRLEQKKLSLAEASQTALASGKDLRQPQALVGKMKRKRRPKMRALHKAEGRAKWSRKLVDKRLGNPKYEGNWMKKALARAQKRDAIVAQKQAAVDEITSKLDVATAQYDELLVVNRQDRNVTKARHAEVSEAQSALKKTVQDLLAGKQAIVNSKKAIRKAKLGVEVGHAS